MSATNLQTKSVKKKNKKKKKQIYKPIKRCFRVELSKTNARNEVHLLEIKKRKKTNVTN